MALQLSCPVMRIENRMVLRVIEHRRSIDHFLRLNVVKLVGIPGGLTVDLAHVVISNRHIVKV